MWRNTDNRGIPGWFTGCTQVGNRRDGRRFRVGNRRSGVVRNRPHSLLPSGFYLYLTSPTSPYPYPSTSDSYLLPTTLDPLHPITGNDSMYDRDLYQRRNRRRNSARCSGFPEHLTMGGRPVRTPSPGFCREITDHLS